jgi:hypothetical protein
MIKLSINASQGEILPFIRNRLTLLLAERKLKEVKRGIASSLIKIKGLGEKVENIDHTIFLLEESDQKSSLLIETSQKINDQIKFHSFGVALRKQKENLTEFFIDEYNQARNRGLLPDSFIRARTGLMNIITGIVIGILLIGAIVFWPLLILVIIFGPIIQILGYFKAKREFKRMYSSMQKIISIFESEFAVSGKFDTKDWVNFWGRIKSTVAQEIEDFVERG